LPRGLRHAEPCLTGANRAGRATGSKASAILARIKSGEAAVRRDYRLQLAVDRMTGKTMESSYTNDEMQRGVALEPVARERYELITGYKVEQSGFLQHTHIMAGCSLDGDINTFDGILEIKCPKSTTHVGYLKSGALPSEYTPQVRHNLWVSGAKWADFFSYDDRLPDKLDTFLVRVYARDMDLPGYERELLKFLDEVDAELGALEQLRAAA
jgi:predicted phage-related endonuclease